MSNWKVRSDDWTSAENQNGSSLTHYGVKGMKWGVRKDGPTGSERKTRKQLTKNLAAAQKTLKETSKASDAANRNALSSEHKLDVELNKKVLPWNRKKQDAKIETVGRRFDKAVERSISAKKRYDKAKEYENKVSDELVSYVNDLTKKYGRDNVKQPSVKLVNIGKDYYNYQNINRVVPMIKTGLVAENLPIIGERTKARKRARLNTY